MATISTEDSTCLAKHVKYSLLLLQPETDSAFPGWTPAGLTVELAQTCACVHARLALRVFAVSAERCVCKLLANCQSQTALHLVCGILLQTLCVNECAHCQLATLLQTLTMFRVLGVSAHPHSKTSLTHSFQKLRPSGCKGPAYVICDTWTGLPYLPITIDWVS